MARGIRRKEASTEKWLRQFPGGKTVFGNCEFLLDCDARGYDWLVVFSDFPPNDLERFSMWEEKLDCPRENTIFVTNEPSSVKNYGVDFLAQFGHVITTQEPEIIRHPNAIYKQSGYRWFYGAGQTPMMDHDAISANPPLEKTQLISTVCSAKRQKHTLHATRYDFTWALKEEIPELEIFGRGVRPVDDKSEALDDFKYHIVVENFVGPDHWSEKLSDSFLGLSLPFYHGCPNAADYFPEGSFIPIDINDYEGSLATIREAIANGEYEKRLEDLLEARRRVLDVHQIFPMVAREIESRHEERAAMSDYGSILSRSLIRKRNPWIAVKMAVNKFLSRMKK
ncbi:glycosyltransferase [Luteolibacter sp. AS25]|uniref:glycosyltransferase n=1 Tax=Luteolibacter sp. AS25 TaxID=3135776 RepID=UPI00398B3614